MTEVKSEIKDFSFFFGQHGKRGMQVGKAKKSGKIKKILWASAADPGIKIRPCLAGRGPCFDYAMRPEPGWR